VEEIGGHVDVETEHDREAPGPTEQGRAARAWWPTALAVAAVAVVLAAIVVRVVDDDSSGADGSVDGAGADAEGEARPLHPGQVAGRGDALPELAVERHDGGTLQLDELQGAPTVINFFASWCAPCVAEMPQFESVHQDLDGDVRFLGVAATDDRESETELLSRTGVTYDTVRDPKGEVMTALGVMGLPATLLVDADGRIAEYHLGELDGEELRSLIDEHLR
jgi:thiol-disulfide isomerase/thioredoxin